MQGIFLKFYVNKHSRHCGILAFEWLLERARKSGIHGGTAIRAVAGFGRHGRLHEEAFIELAADLPVEIGFVLNNDEAEHFLALLRQEKLELFYVKFPVEYGVLPK